MANVDARGDQCPIPVVKAKKAMTGMKAGEVLEVLVDNEIAVQNVSKMAGNAGAGHSSEKIGDNEYKITITVGESAAESTAAGAVTCEPDRKGNTVVVIASDRMGSGNDELGGVLIKGFIYAITQLEELPRAVIFYNGGAKLSAEGSDSIEDLKSLEAQGVEIMTCGTCLNYYELTDKLQVGSVTNMYAIVEKLAEADKVIRP